MERGISQHRRNVQSATYFLVWHCGMTIENADALLSRSKKLIKPLAQAGREEFKKCAKALCKFIDKTNDRQKKWKAR